jgi:hypothetical protein
LLIPYNILLRDYLKYCPSLFKTALADSDLFLFKNFGWCTFLNGLSSNYSSFAFSLTDLSYYVPWIIRLFFWTLKSFKKTTLDEYFRMRIEGMEEMQAKEFIMRWSRIVSITLNKAIAPFSLTCNILSKVSYCGLKSMSLSSSKKLVSILILLVSRIIFYKYYSHLFQNCYHSYYNCFQL